MDIIRNRPQTAVAPKEWFTGTVYLDGLAPSDQPSELRAYRVHFTPTARTAWHSHPHGQLLHITDGVGRVQREGSAVEQVTAGDTVRIAPGEVHWHGAAPGNFMTHIAFQMSGEDGEDASWGELVSDAEYEAAG
ncbi:MAG TPA: cupin domain-containing protein [Solirubrobacteraceae bacterium]|jgi:quercetin dioxygenase-like cupin family protein|nr:cupin domain-containing protein [Solirubrobacteraceae bacterium]